VRGESMRECARKLRKNLTDAERVLWQILRNRQLVGRKSRRQHPIGPFFVDFVCIVKKLVIEVDGGQHADSLQEDFKRTRYLANKGYRVVRFWNNEVLKESDAIPNSLLKFLSDSPSPYPSPHKGARET
jgi:very-short-patch-repair endonuclease